MSNTKQLIDAIIAGDAVTIQDTFNQAMVERIADRLDMMRQDVARNMFATEETLEDAEVEQIDEGTFQVTHKYGREVVKAKDERDAMRKASKKAGIAKGHEGSVKKISEEEELSLEDYSIDELEDFMVSEDFEQLDELSKKTLANYINKAHTDGNYAAADARELSHPDRSRPPETDADRRARDDAFRKATTRRSKRRDGISRAIDKLTREEADLSEDTLLEFTHGKEYSHKAVMNKIESGNWEAMNDVSPGKMVELKHHTGKRVTVYVK